MSAVFDEREQFFFRAPLFKREYGDYTPFYVVIAICTVFGFFLAALNIVLCCSRYRDYWCDSNTGNRWVLPIWTKTPHGQPPLDLTELDEAWIPEVETELYYPDNYSDEYYQPPPERTPHQEFVQLVEQHKPFVKKESDL